MSKNHILKLSFKSFFLSLMVLNACSCRTPFKVSNLTVKEPHTVKATPKADLDLDSSMADRYQKAKKPSFALIDGFYSLPQTKPYGAAGIVQNYSYQIYFEVNDAEKPYAVVPMSGDDALGRNRALNKLLDIGVKIKELSLTDALAIAKAENKAEKDKQIFKPSTVLAPGVDYLMSIYPASSKEGPILVGRVIKSDGTLLAFRAVDHGQIDRLIISLFEDTLGRIGK